VKRQSMNKRRVARQFDKREYVSAVVRQPGHRADRAFSLIVDSHRKELAVPPVGTIPSMLLRPALVQFRCFALSSLSEARESGSHDSPLALSLHRSFLTGAMRFEMSKRAAARDIDDAVVLEIALGLMELSVGGFASSI
jgi:hypothetical protein